MEDNKDLGKFLLSENYKHQIDIWFKAHNISYEKLVLFYDFLMSLYNLVDETYLGVDAIINDKDMKGHFDWCWNKTIDNFSKERIYFKDYGSHYDYIWNFFYEAYYIAHINSTKIKIKNYFKILFDFNHVKSRSEIDVLSELYKIINDSLKK